MACSQDLPGTRKVAAVDADLVLLHETGPMTVSQFDAATGQDELVYTFLPYSVGYSLSVGPDGELAVSMSPVPEADEEPAQGSEIRRLVDGVLEPMACDAGALQKCFFPRWARSGETLSYVRTGAGLEPGSSVLETVSTVEQSVAWRADAATEPAVAPDGSLAWVSVDPVTLQRSLRVWDASTNAERVVLEPDVYDLGLPMFSADGTSLYVVRLSPMTAWHRVLQLGAAWAHNGHDQPGDWWRVSLDGSDPVQVSYLSTILYAGAIDPNGDTLYTATREGVQRVDLATGDARVVLADRTVRDLDVMP